MAQPKTLPQVTLEMVIKTIPSIKKQGSTYIGGSMCYVTFEDYQAASGGRSVNQVVRDNDCEEITSIARLLMTMLREN